MISTPRGRPLLIHQATPRATAGRDEALKSTGPRIALLPRAGAHHRHPSHAPTAITGAHHPHTPACATKTKANPPADTDPRPTPSQPQHLTHHLAHGPDPLAPAPPTSPAPGPNPPAPAPPTPPPPAPGLPAQDPPTAPPATRAPPARDPSAASRTTPATPKRASRATSPSSWSRARSRRC